jgi:putative CocE/NonD family hydrolase
MIKLLARRSWLQLLAVAGVGLMSASPAIAETDLCNVGVTMSDGAVMRANVALPGPGRHSTIMIVTGYDKDSGNSPGQCPSYDENLTRAGFNVVIFDDRGTGSSDGTWGVWDARTQLDYKQELAWIERQPWSNGKIGTTGASYLAITSMLAAATGDPHVKAVFAVAPAADPYRDVVYFGGELDTTFMPLWMGLDQNQNTNLPTQLTQGDVSGSVALNIFDHFTGGPAVVDGTAIASALALDERNQGLDSPYDDSEYRFLSVAAHAAKIHAAVFWVGGWYDIFQRGEPYLFRALDHTPPGGKVWVQGPTYHVTDASMPQWPQLGYGASEEDTEIAWFQHWLDGAHNIFGPDGHVARANLYDIGANRWQKEPSWPLPRTRWTKMYLSASPSGSITSLHDGSLTLSKSAATGSERMPFQAAGDLCSRSSAQWSAGIAAGTPCETNEASSETSELTFTTPVMRRPTHIAGPITLRLWATLTGASDTVFYTALTDVDGSTSTTMTSGALDGEFRAVKRSMSWHDKAGQTILPYHPFTATSLQAVPAGRAVLYQIEIFPTDWTILPGHRLRLIISTADTPHFAVPADRLAQMLGGTITVLSSGAHRSSLLLPLQGS